MKKPRNCSGEYTRLSGSDYYYEDKSDIVVVVYPKTGGSTSCIIVRIPLEKLEKTVNRYHTKRLDKWKD
jgi:hypothetical protein